MMVLVLLMSVCTEFHCWQGG